MSVFLLSISLVVLAPPTDDTAPGVSHPPPYADFLVIPLRVHILKSENMPQVNCLLADTDIDRIIGKVNHVWHPAGIHFGLESIAREPAEHEDAFAALNENAEEARRLPHDLFRVLRPQASRRLDGLHVYYVHDFDVNGVYMGRDFAFVKETARLREVQGGIDEPIPRVTSHELGHALGLPHREDRTNLLASGTTGTSLNAAEIEWARARARKLPGVNDVAELRKLADAAQRDEQLDQARRYWTWLAQVPGDGAAEARQRLESIPDGRNGR